jgi:hypothetical protein
MRKPMYKLYDLTKKIITYGLDIMACHTLYLTFYEKKSSLVVGKWQSKYHTRPAGRVIM